jgi:hypothetical protein
MKAAHGTGIAEGRKGIEAWAFGIRQLRAGISFVMVQKDGLLRQLRPARVHEEGVAARSKRQPV